MEGKKYDVIVAGAGAAGLMAAATAARDGRSVLLVEKMEKAARKVRITGKGRCNVTNIKPREEFLEHVRSGRDFLVPALEGFDSQATIDFFRRSRVELTIERGDRVFPASGKAWDIADALVKWAERWEVDIAYRTRVESIITLGNKVFGVKIATKRGFSRNIEAPNVIVSTGGLSYPATGSTGDGYLFADSTGHRIAELRPALVPLESDSPYMENLKGLQLKNVGIRLISDGQVVQEEFGELEFGDRGVEGAVILRISRKAVDSVIEGKRSEMEIDLKPALDRDTLIGRIAREREALPPAARFSELLRKLMPRQLVEVIAKELGIDPAMKLPLLTTEQIESLISGLKSFRFNISDYRPFEEAVVTAGGVSLEDVDPETMRSRIINGLYFAGEVLDIDGDTGGYNLQIAFSTGCLAGKLK